MILSHTTDKIDKREMGLISRFQNGYNISLLPRRRKYTFGKTLN